MNYKSKYTASEIDAKLSQVFDSTLQTKAVEVSEDTTIKADEGFLGLKEVSVKVSGGGGSASAWRYFKLNEGWANEYHSIILFAMSACFDNGQTQFIAATPILPYVNNGVEITDMTKIAIDASFKINLDGVLASFNDMSALFGITEKELLEGWNLSEITEEEFYTL